MRETQRARLGSGRAPEMVVWCQNTPRRAPSKRRAPLQNRGLHISIPSTGMLMQSDVSRLSSEMFREFNVNGRLKFPQMRKYYRRIGETLNFNDYVGMCEGLGCNSTDGLSSSMFNKLIRCKESNEVIIDYLTVFQSKGHVDRLMMLFDRFSGRGIMTQRQFENYYEMKFGRFAGKEAQRTFLEICASARANPSEGIDLDGFMNMERSTSKITIHSAFVRTFRPEDLTTRSRNGSPNTSPSHLRYPTRRRRHHEQHVEDIPWQPREYALQHVSRTPPRNYTVSRPKGRKDNNGVAGVVLMGPYGGSHSSSMQDGKAASFGPAKKSRKTSKNLDPEVAWRLERLFIFFSDNGQMRFEEMQRYQQATAETPLNREDYMKLCSHTGADPEKGLGLQAFFAVAGNTPPDQVVVDFEAVFGKNSRNSPNAHRSRLCVNLPTKNRQRDAGDRNGAIQESPPLMPLRSNEQGYISPTLHVESKPSPPPPSKESMSTNGCPSQYAPLPRHSSRRFKDKKTNASFPDRSFAKRHTQNHMEDEADDRMTVEESPSGEKDTYEMLLWLYKRFTKDGHFGWQSMCAYQDIAGHSSLDRNQYQALCRSLNCQPATGLKLSSFLQAASLTPPERLKNDYERVRAYDRGVFQGSLSGRWADLGVYWCKDHTDQKSFRIPTASRATEPIFLNDPTKSGSLRNASGGTRGRGSERYFNPGTNVGSRINSPSRQFPSEVAEDLNNQSTVEQQEQMHHLFHDDSDAKVVAHKESKEFEEKIFQISSEVVRELKEVAIGDIGISSLKVGKVRDDPDGAVVRFRHIRPGSKEFDLCDQCLNPSRCVLQMGHIHTFILGTNCRNLKPDRQYKLERVVQTYSVVWASKMRKEEGNFFFNSGGTRQLASIAKTGYGCINTEVVLSQLLQQSDKICKMPLGDIPDGTRLRWRALLSFSLSKSADKSNEKEPSTPGESKTDSSTPRCSALSRDCIPCFLFEYSFLNH